MIGSKGFGGQGFGEGGGSGGGGGGGDDKRDGRNHGKDNSNIPSFDTDESVATSRNDNSTDSNGTNNGAIVVSDDPSCITIPGPLANVSNDEQQHRMNLINHIANSVMERQPAHQPNDDHHRTNLINDIANAVTAHQIAVTANVPGAFRVSPHRGVQPVGAGASISSGSNDAPSPSAPVFTNENLPPNIDIIAEATLVEEGEGSNGVPGGSPPQEVISPEDAASVAMSAITAPTAPTALPGNDEESGMIRTETTSTREQVVPQENTEDTNNQSGSGNQEQGSQHPSNVYEATLVKDGPFAFLSTKGGKMCSFVSVILIIILSISLAVGLSTRKSTDESKEEESTDNKILTYAAGNFCGETSAPHIFYDTHPSSFCTKEELQLGGIIQQAIAIAQHRPHPSDYCQTVLDNSNTTTTVTKESPKYEGEPITDPNPYLCQVSNLTPDISLINGGAVRGEFAVDTPITKELLYETVPFTGNTIAYMQLTKEDIVRVLNNALNFVTQDGPDELNLYHSGAYPYASGLRYEVDLSFSEESSSSGAVDTASAVRVSNVQVFDKDSNEWVAIEQSKKESYWIVTNDWIALGGDNYLDGVQPLYNGLLSGLKYVDELVKFCEDLGFMGENWVPPSMDEMSTTSFTY